MSYYTYNSIIINIIIKFHILLMKFYNSCNRCQWIYNSKIVISSPHLGHVVSPTSLRRNSSKVPLYLQLEHTTVPLSLGKLAHANPSLSGLHPAPYGPERKRPSMFSDATTSASPVWSQPRQWKTP